MEPESRLPCKALTFWSSGKLVGDLSAAGSLTVDLTQGGRGEVSRDRSTYPQLLVSRHAEMLWHADIVHGLPFRKFAVGSPMRKLAAHDLALAR